MVGVGSARFSADEGEASPRRRVATSTAPASFARVAATVRSGSERAGDGGGVGRGEA